MLDRKTLLGLAVAGLLIAGPVARSFAAPVVPPLALVVTTVASDEDEKDDKKHDEKDEKKEKKKEVETDVPMAMVPQAVIDAVMKECPGGKITESELEAKHGKIMYGFDVKVGGMTYDVNISVDGKFISKKVDDDGDDEKDEKKPAEKK